MSTLLLVVKTDDGQVLNVPFTYHDGELMQFVENVADVLAGMGMPQSVWEGIAADRLRIILEQRRKLAEQSDVIASMKEAVGVMAL